MKQYNKYKKEQTFTPIISKNPQNYSADHGYGRVGNRSRLGHR